LLLLQLVLLLLLLVEIRKIEATAH